MDVRRCRNLGATAGALLSLFVLASSACAVDDEAGRGLAEITEDDEYDRAGTVCAPRMHVFPVAAEHNIGYDNASCGSGTCAVSCPDAHANSDWGGSHHGIDVFAHKGAPLVAVSAATVVAVGTPSDTSGLRVRLRDECGWEYYYGHLDSAAVSKGQHVEAGQVVGYMGNTGTSGVHLHFNISPDGDYKDDINPFDLLQVTSPTACGASPAPTPPPPPPPAAPTGGCGLLEPYEAIGPGQNVTSCDGRFVLVLHEDGNLVLWQSGVGPLWSSQTKGTTPGQLVMQGDGNLVLYDAFGTAVWHIGTHGHEGAFAVIQDDGNFVVYDSSATVPLWNTKTCCR